VAALVRRTLQSRPKDSAHWTVRTIARESRLYPATVHRIWRAFGLHPPRQRHFRLCTDPYFVEKVRDIVDHAHNPGGALDFGGLSSGDMLGALFQLGQGPLLGLDIVEVYPRSDVNEASVHLMVWQVIYALAGVALRRRRHSRG